MPSPALLLQSNSELNRKRTGFKKSQNNSNDASSAASMLNSFSHEELKMIRKPVSSTGNSKSGQKGWTPIGRVWPIKEQESRKGAVSERVRKREFRNCCTVGFTLLGHTGRLLVVQTSHWKPTNCLCACAADLAIGILSLCVLSGCIVCGCIVCGCIVCVSPEYCTVYLCVGVLSVCTGERSLNTSS